MAPRPAAPQERELAHHFAAAFTRDDIDAVIRLLTDDAWLTMPLAPHEYHGHDAIAAFLHVSADWRAGRRVRLVPTRANTQPAYTCYLADPPGPTAHPTGLLVLTLSDQRISAITRFLDEGPDPTLRNRRHAPSLISRVDHGPPQQAGMKTKGIPIGGWQPGIRDSPIGRFFRHRTRILPR